MATNGMDRRHHNIFLPHMLRYASGTTCSIVLLDAHTVMLGAFGWWANYLWQLHRLLVLPLFKHKKNIHACILPPWMYAWLSVGLCLRLCSLLLLNCSLYCLSLTFAREFHPVLYRSSNGADNIRRILWKSMLRSKWANLSFSSWCRENSLGEH